jgi:hypothetical protein
MKKIIFFLSVLPCLYASAQKPASPIKPKASSDISKTSAKQNIQEQKTIANPVSWSPIVPIHYNGPVIPPAANQAKDILLWYNGKKVNDSILITPDATLVLYNKSRNIIVVQPPAKKDPSLQIIKRLEDIEKQKKELIEIAAAKKNSFFLYPHITATLKEYEKQNEEYKNALKNTIPVPAPVSTAAIHSYTTGGPASVRLKMLMGIPAAVKQAYDEVMQKMKSYPSLDFPPPPQENFGGCYECDGIAKNQYAIDRYKWDKEFTKYEADLVARSQSIFKTMELLALNSDPESTQIRAGLAKAIEFAFARMKNKVDLLIKNYGSDFTRLPSIIRMALSIERQKQLISGNENTYGETIKKLMSILDGFDKYVDQQMAARNYDVVFNLAFLIGTERQKQLLGGLEENNAASLLERIIAFNRFKISMEADFNVTCNNDDGTCPIISSSGKLATKKDFYVSLAPYKCGSFQIFLTNTLYKPETEALNRELYYSTSPVEMDIYELELTASEGIKKTLTVDDEGNKKIITESYTGGVLLSHLPVARISFCKEKEDTLYLQSYYNKGGETSGKGYGMQLYLNFLFAGNTEEELEPHINKIAGDAEAYRKRMKAYEVDATGFDKLDRLQNQSKIMDLYQQNTEYVITNAMKNAAIVFDAENGAEEIMNAAADASGNRIEDYVVNKGVVKVKIVHDPLPVKPK